jgi:hypothetical protein
MYRQDGGRNLPRLLLRIVGLQLLLALLVLAAASCKTTPSMGADGVANVDPIPAGSVEAQFPRLFSSAVEKKTINVVFRPRDNMVYLEFKYQTVTYRQYWNLANRARFREALEKYKAEYEGRTLVDRPNRTRRSYGVLKGMTQWGYPVNLSILVLALNSQGHPNYELGYVFKQDSSRRESPYFTVFQRECKDELMTTDSLDINSLNIFTYYTRSQAEELVKLFDQDYLLSLITQTVIKEASPDSDEY